MTFDLSNYEPVEDRLRAFWSDHPDGRVLTELVRAEGGEFIVKASVWREAFHDDIVLLPAGTGYAQETVTERGVNSTSALENCETSAIGRALANLGYAPKGARPSREEMSKASRSTSGSGAPPSHAGSKTDSSATSPSVPESATSVAAELTPAGAAESGSGGEAGMALGKDSDSPPDPGLQPHEPVWIDSPTVRNMQMCAVTKCSLHPSRRKTAEVPA